MAVSAKEAIRISSSSYYRFTDGQWRYYASGSRSRGNPTSAEPNATAS